MAQNSGQQRRQDVLIAALARGESQTAAAKSAGFSLRTVQRRLDDPQFREAVQQLRNKLVADVAGQVAGLMESAADALRELLASADEVVRLSAAKATFDIALKLRTTADLESRLLLLEGQLHGQSRNTSQAS